MLNSDAGFSPAGAFLKRSIAATDLLPFSMIDATPDAPGPQTGSASMPQETSRLAPAARRPTRRGFPTSALVTSTGDNLIKTGLPTIR